MRLAALEGQLLKILDDRSMRHVETVAEADGVSFLCPKCFAAKGDNIGVHTVMCWFTGVSAHVSPGPGRWNPHGTTIEDLTFVPPGAVSVMLMDGCQWHGHVRNGDAE